MTTGRQAMRLLRQRAADLSAVTGIPADQILDEMMSTELSPGQWAQLHGLDPVTFQPRELTDDQVDATLQRLWERIRLDDAAPLPAPDVLEEIRTLLESFARNELYLFEEGAPLLSEIEEQKSLLVMLHDRGARMDAEWLNSSLRQAGAREAPPLLKFRTQEQWDEHQTKAAGNRRP